MPAVLLRSTVVSALYTTAKTEGVLALWRGLVPTLAGVVPSRACYFACYRQFQPLLMTFNHNQPHPVLDLASGFIAGFITTTLTNPAWVIKTRVQLLMSEPAAGQTAAHKPRLWPLIRYMYQTEGLRGFMRGVSASYIGA